MSKADIATTGQKASKHQNASENDRVDDDSDVEFELDDEPEKSETEEELEKLVFGDSAGFRETLKSSALAEEDLIESEDEITGLEGLNDADVGQAPSKSK